MSLHIEGKEVFIGLYHIDIILIFITNFLQEIPETGSGGSQSISNRQLSEFLLRLGLANNNAVKSEPRDREEEAEKGKMGEISFGPVSF